jgi:exonuclease VII small subunit
MGKEIERSLDESSERLTEAEKALQDAKSALQKSQEEVKAYLSDKSKEEPAPEKSDDKADPQ